jgi:low affinity Fe/Cu permease
VALLGLVTLTLASLALGPLIGWLLAQVILTTVLTVVTQLTAMLLQGSQLRQERAVQAKLDEVIRAIPQADNRLRGIEEV